ncbi:unnamed protein product [Callosobruchus maculatus]|uniref:Transposase domain-containing protein n=1 Tax=Callosobruchus maculatus TaxID=64391 RepID=A0A653DNJ5_CALMS|nr:unnamed protein product [Callosobruchus maculatus]
MLPKDCREMASNKSEELRSLIYSKKKTIVGERQVRRRVAASVKNILQDQSQDAVNNCLHNQNSDTVSNTYLPTYSDNINSDISDDSSEHSTAADFTVITDIEDNIEVLPVASHTNNTASNLAKQLQRWAVDNKITHLALNNLLKILSPFHTDLCLDSRTLLNTPQQAKFRKLENGELIYFGFSKFLAEFVSGKFHIKDNIIEISFNIDGLPLFHSSSTCLWPILGLIKHNFVQKPFPITVFCGTSKPSPLHMFLDNFVSDLKVLLKDGFKYNNKTYSIKIHSFVCDAPARAFIKCIKTHTGYYACEKCTQCGEYFNGRVIMRSVSCPKRNDLQFQLHIDEDHHLGVSPLLDLSFGLVSCFPIDYMHAVCLGVMRKLLNTWTCGKLSVRLPAKSVSTISQYMVNIRKCIPFEFSRKSRSLSDLARWKATEFRLFLLYLGPIVLKNVLPISIYENFMLLHCGIIILCSKTHISLLGYEFAGELLNKFIKHCEIIYGKEFLVYNVHLLCHLSDDVAKYGPLDEFSSFPFENYLGQMKHLVRSYHKPLQQIYKRLMEMGNFDFNVSENKIDTSLEHNMGPTPCHGKYKQFQKLKYGNSSFSTYSHSEANCYFLKGNVVIRVYNILVEQDNSNIFLYGKQFSNYSSLYTYPFDSNLINISVVSLLSSDLNLYSISDISCKCILIPLNSGTAKWASLPLIHKII